MATTRQPEKIDSILPRTEVGQVAEVQQWIAEAVAARQAYEQAGTEYARYVTEEAELEADRPTVKHEAVLRIMADGKIAATNAEKLASLDGDYLSHLEAQRDTVAKKNEACTRMQSAKLRAELAIAAIRSIAGLI